MERLSSLDSVFLAVEDSTNQMNIGTVAVFEGPVPDLDEVQSFLAPRIARVPRCRQRVREPSGLLGRPAWIDDVRFDLRAHVRALSLADRDGRDLRAVVADLVADPLDRSRPLWEITVVDGLEGDRWALIAKVHHCMVDGIAGSDLLHAILDGEPDASAAEPVSWAPTPEPSASEVAWWNVRAAVQSFLVHVRHAVEVLVHLPRSLGRARRIVQAARRLWSHQQHPPTSLTGPIGTQRNWTHVTVSFDDVRAIRATLDGTVNDVVVAAVAHGFRDLLIERGESVEHRTITAMVPVSLRAPAERGQTGNRVANVHALLPVGSGDARTTLRAVHEHLDELKTSHEVEATGLLLSIGDFVPRVVADRIARLVVRRQRNVETVITNVPGPRVPLYFGHRRMLAGFPVAPIAGRVRLSVAIWSYCDQLCIGITGDRDTTPDLEHLGRGIEHGFATLLAAARSARAD